MTHATVITGAKRDHLLELDGLRGVAVLLVLWSHLEKQEALPWPPLEAGAFGVDLFFALSGFLITRILLYNREHEIGFWHFYRRRILRIFPAYYVMLAGTALWFGVNDHWLWAVGYLYNFLPMEPEPIVHAWSLCVEEHFYLVWPMFMLWLPMAVSRRLCSYGLASVLIGLVGFESWSIYHNWYDYEWIIDRTTPFRIGTLMLGALVACYEHRLRGRQTGMWWALATVIGALALNDVILIARDTLGIGGERSALIAWRALLAMACLLLVLSGQCTPLTELMRMDWLQWVGRISYGLYLYHLPIYQALHVVEWGPGLSTLMAALAVGLTFAVAWLSYTYFEQPLIQWGRRLEQAGAPSQGASLPA